MFVASFARGLIAQLLGAMSDTAPSSWADYPLSSAAYEPSLYNGSEIRRQLRSPPTHCFSADETEIRFFDIYDGAQGRYLPSSRRELPLTMGCYRPAELLRTSL